MNSQNFYFDNEKREVFLTPTDLDSSLRKLNF